MPGVDSQGPAHRGGDMWDGRAGTGCWVGMLGRDAGSGSTGLGPRGLRACAERCGALVWWCSGVCGGVVLVWCWCGADTAVLGRWDDGTMGAPGVAGRQATKAWRCTAIDPVQSARACLRCNATCLLSLRDMHACRSGLCLWSLSLSLSLSPCHIHPFNVCLVH